MSNQPVVSGTQTTNSSLFRRTRGKSSAQPLTSAMIAADIAAFKKRGGRIEILGVTPYRPHIHSTFRSRANAAKNKAATTAASKRAATKTAAPT